MAGAGMKAIKNRIASVNSTKQITNAMHLVASSKLRKAKQATENSSAYFNTMYETIVNISVNTKGINSQFLKARDLKARCHIVIAGDRGLAGGYNSNVIDRIESAEKYEYEEVRAITDKLMKMYEDGQIDEVILTYTEFESALSQKPRAIKLLPLVFDQPLEYGGERYREKQEENDPNVFISEEILRERYERREEEAREAEEFVNKFKKTEASSRAKVQYLPSAKSVLEFLIPTYITGTVNGAIVESYASEQGARRTAMESATDNANEMIQNLELSYNRARQSAVTQEITEISGGVEALK